MNERFVGRVIGWDYQDRSVGTRYCGAVYDTNIRRADSGDMAQDFGFVKFLADFATPDQAAKVLEIRLAELNR